MIQASALPARTTFDHISFSAIKLFSTCPLHFYFKYIAGLPEETIASSLVLGTGIHSALQFHFEQLLAGSPPPSLDTLLDVFWGSWRGRDHQEVIFNKGEDVNSIGQVADRLLRTFQANDFSRPTGRIIAVEEELRGPLIPGLPDLLARVDLLIETEDSLEISDFKTSRSAWGGDQVTDGASQLLLYTELVKQLSDGKPLRLAFAVLTKAKVPDLTVYPVPFDEQEVVRTKVVVERVWRAILSGHFYPAPSPINCPRCPFRRHCRAWAG